MKRVSLLIVIVLLGTSIDFAQKSYGSDLSATIAIPTGPNSEYYKLGYGAIGGFYYEMESNWRFGLTLGFIRFGVDGGAVNDYFQTLGQEGYTDVTGSISTIPILFSAKYLFPTSSGKLYAVIEAGVYTYWTKLKGSITYTGSIPGVTPIDKSEFSSEAGFNLGLGALFPLSKDISLDINARYNFIQNSQTIKIDYYSDERKIGSSHFINFGIGANWNFDL